MKKSIKKFSVIFPFLLLLQPLLYAQNDNDKKNHEKKYEFVKNKSINKSYNVSTSDKLDIENSFGSVDIHTWDRNEIKVDVLVEVSANTEALAQRIIDRIIVSDAQSGKEISFKTTIKNNNNSKGEKSSMKVNYSISMPASNPLQVKNDFGTITLPDYKGEVDLTSKFGKLNTGNLSNVKNIQVEFGKANLGNIIGGNVNIKYSSASINRLSGTVKLNLEFSNKVFLNLDNSLNSLDMKVSYSTVNLKPVNDLPASYTVFTSFGSFKNRTGIKFSSKEEDDDDHGPQFDHEYTGKSGNGNIMVKVKSNFSTIILGEATAEDMKDKQKQKAKSVSI